MKPILPVVLSCFRRQTRLTGPLVGSVLTTTALECYGECEADNSCNFFSFEDGLCSLFNARLGGQESASAMSGSKACVQKRQVACFSWRKARGDVIRTVRTTKAKWCVESCAITRGCAYAAWSSGSCQLYRTVTRSKRDTSSQLVNVRCLMRERPGGCLVKGRWHGLELRKESTPRVSECLNICDDTEGCEFFSHDGAGLCRLLGRVTGLTRDDSIYSGTLGNCVAEDDASDLSALLTSILQPSPTDDTDTPVTRSDVCRQQGVAYIGEQLETKANTSLDACVEMCRDDASCAFVTWAREFCTLLEDAAPQEADEEFVSVDMSCFTAA